VKAWILAVLVLLPVEALACATCVGAPWDKADHGFYWSTLFLMGVPFVVAGIIGGWLFYHFRRAPAPGGKWEPVRLAGPEKEENE
jgi:hypothetical protein